MPETNYAFNLTHFALFEEGFSSGLQPRMLLVHFLAGDKLKISLCLLIFQGKGIIWKFSHFPRCSNVQTKYGMGCGIIPCEHFNMQNNISMFIQIQIFFPDINVAVFFCRGTKDYTKKTKS